MGILVCLEALPVKGEIGDLGHWPPEHALNQTMTAAKRSATVPTIFHSCANRPCKSLYDGFSNHKSTHFSMKISIRQNVCLIKLNDTNGCES